MRKSIAIVEDEPALRENYADALRQDGYDVHTYENKADSLAAFKSTLPDLAIIDIMLGEETEAGFELCRELRTLSKTLPIIFLTARDAEPDEISGFRLDADEYLTKDDSIAVIKARVAALFRRIDAYKAEPGIRQPHRVDDLSIDDACMTVEWKNEKIVLTPKEFWMLYSLVKQPGQVKSREQLMEAAKTTVDDSTVTSHIKRIRNKFEALDDSFDRIENVYGIGYRWLKN